MPVLEARYSREFQTDLRRLARKHPELARELENLLLEELLVSGTVSEEYFPHILNKPGGTYNGCMEFHLREDVLVLYSPPNPTRSVTMRRICTHAELATSRFSPDWPN